MTKLTILLIFVICLVKSALAESADTNLIKAHLKAITKAEKYRTHQNIDQLNKIADYIFHQFAKYADTVYFQEYAVHGKTYKNVVALFGRESNNRIVIGAHYDVCGSQEGADDNASGIVGLLELARLLDKRSSGNQMELVAYTLEEPPYFRTEFMGSYIHAKSLADNAIMPLGMVSLEMIGYFRDEKKTQDYPLGMLSLIYGSRGNYITLVKKFGAGKFTRQFCRNFKRTESLRTKKFNGPPGLPGIDFSDHLNYWKFGFSALMLTDTAFYRNKNYHESSDTMETLDINKMAKVINGVYQALAAM